MLLHLGRTAHRPCRLVPWPGPGAVLACGGKLVEVDRMCPPPPQAKNFWRVWVCLGGWNRYTWWSDDICPSWTSLIKDQSKIHGRLFVHKAKERPPCSCFLLCRFIDGAACCWFTIPLHHHLPSSCLLPPSALHLLLPASSLQLLLFVHQFCVAPQPSFASLR